MQETGSNRCVPKHPVVRLMWVGLGVCDASRLFPYHYSRLVFHDRQLITAVQGRESRAKGLSPQAVAIVTALSIRTGGRGRAIADGYAGARRAAAPPSSSCFATRSPSDSASAAGPVRLASSRTVPSGLRTAARKLRVIPATAAAAPIGT